MALNSPSRPAQGAGATWSQVDPPADDAVHSLALSGSAILGGTYYNGLFRIDGGTTQPASAASPLAAIETDPGDASSVIAGAWIEGVLVSSDGGQTWTSDNGGLEAIDVYSFAFIAGERYAGTSSGVFFRDVSGWTPRSIGLEARNVFSLLADGSTLYAGTEHGVFSSTDGGMTWQAASSGLGDLPAYSLALTGTRVVAGTGRGIAHSDDGGATWSYPDPGVGALTVRSLAVMTAEPSVVFAGTADGPFVSEDAGATWQPFNKGLTGEARKVFSIALVGTNPELLYIGTGSGIWQSSFEPTTPTPTDAPPTITPTPTKIANDGNLAGVSDIVVGDINSGQGLFYCIVKTDHASATNEIKTHVQCNIDLPDGGVAPLEDPITPPSWHDTCEALSERVPPECLIGPGSSDSQLNNPSETGADALAGPPPPPPYTNLVPAIGLGAFYPGGAGAPDGVCGATDCTVVTSCFEDTGPISGTGPNIISRVTLLDPKGGTTIMADTDGDTVKDTQVDRISEGTVDFWYNQNNANCKARTPKGDPTVADLPLQSIQVSDKGGANVNPNPAPWRPGPKPGASVLDFDGDGCTDEQELDPKDPGKCGDDPQNPSDSFSDASTVDLSGVYDILARLVRSDCADAQCTTEVPGIYLYCRADLQHDQPSNDVGLRAYCYTDSVATEINPEAYPGLTGDGMAGAPPPGPQNGAGSGDFAYGDLDLTHTVLSGTFNKATNNFEISGCFEDQDGQSNLGHVYVRLVASAHQVPGTVDMWVLQNVANCQSGTPVGDPAFNDAELTLWQANPQKGKGYDQDDDGVPTERELQDDSQCGRRDPYNKNDYYDVSIPRDGVIDLSNDILGVILHYAPSGYPVGDENWDRPPVMAGADAGSTWNRGSPDGVIDLANDILGVIFQYNPGGCPALS